MQEKSKEIRTSIRRITNLTPIPKPRNKKPSKVFEGLKSVSTFSKTYLFMATKKASNALNIERQAVIVIHGIGEQRPMDTLRDFVELIAPPIEPAKDKNGNPLPAKKKFFNKPDVLSETFELRRLTANAHADSFKTDYFEYYWADKMSGTKASDIYWWFKEILLRPIKNIPDRIVWIYLVFWISLVLTLGIMLILFLHWLPDIPISSCLTRIIESKSGVLPIFSKYLLPLALAIFNFYLINYLGDAVRYMTPSAGNIKQRQDIRKTGIELLKKIHAARVPVTDAKGNVFTDAQGKVIEKNKYDRIILVGHSLGSVIAYDLIKFLWINHNEHIFLSEKEIADLEALAETLTKSKEEPDIKKNRAVYREKQFELWKKQHQNLDSWRISDFITLGSPLAHAELLLAKNPEQLDLKIKDREFPVCPPVPEKGNEFHFEISGKKVLHHAAPFALTRWTNFTFEQDYVGGNIEVFGKGIENHFEPSEVSIRNIIPFIAHTNYWNRKDEKMYKRIREKLQLMITAK
ncbi:hypothetical protein [Emticicia agri]|uniref:Uncharacterized protein n=1 Tax=Emticicia agri TaxID=2492393 RepID=A0A4Q5LT46_9BACT|nr:hypothetical protein [Emticicia agri]RYU92599.1 hypothetical protein EWM59_26355 [Emticicia agri]